MSHDSSLQARRIVVTGVVQGVGYRWNTVQQAQLLGLLGWVRNRRDGSVEAVAQGSSEMLVTLIAWLRIGPAGARVDHVHVEQESLADDTLKDFVQRPTA